MVARMYIWPRYALEVNGKRVYIPRTAGAALARLYSHAIRAPGHYLDTEEMVEAAYFDREDGGPLTAANCVNVTVHKARKALAKIGVRIEGVRGRHGCYRLVLPQSETTTGVDRGRHRNPSAGHRNADCRCRHRASAPAL